VLDDVLAGLLGEAAFGRLRQTERSQRLARLFFGLLGTALGLAGALYLPMTVETSNWGMLASMTALFVSMSGFFLFNVMLAQPWRWPGLCFAASLTLVFATRIIGGR
jgi:hypothetical protein